MGYDFKIEYEGKGDITSKISQFTITDAMGQYAREMTIAIADFDFWNSFDFSEIPTDPTVTIYTKIGDSWVSQGEFFVERPTLSITRNESRIQSLWGRSKNAKLGPPFAGRISKLWTSDTTFYDIIDEMADLVGLSFSDSNSDVSNYKIYGYTYSVENAYPIDVISELAAFAGGMVSTDKDDAIRIVTYNFSPTGPLWSITDSNIENINESLEFPEFGNRIRITPGGSIGGFSINMYVENPCLPADGTTKSRILVQIFDSDGIPIQDETVSWSHDGTYASLDYEETNTEEVLFQDAKIKSDNYYDFELELIPSEIVSVYAYTDTAKLTDLSTGYSIDGRTVTLATALEYCDQTLLVTYKAQGIAINYLQAGSTAEDVTVTAELKGQKASSIIYIDNPCECPVTLTMESLPSSIRVGENSKILAYAEASGPVTSGRTIFMSQGTQDQKKGDLLWDYSKLTTVSISNEKTVARNELGDNVCLVSKYISSVTSVKTYTQRSTGPVTPIGDNLYSSHNGKVITLNTDVADGTGLVVSYVAYGCALNVFQGTSPGNAKIKGWLIVNTEDPVEAYTTVTISDPENITIPPDYVDENGNPTDPDDKPGLPSNTPDEWAPEDQDDPEYKYPSVQYPEDPADPNEGSGCGSSGEPCPDGQVCCHSVADGQSPIYVACNDPCDCLGGLWPACEDDDAECKTTDVSDPTNEDELGDRFSSQSEYCTCLAMCVWEFNQKGTTQGYDGGSGRTIKTIIEDDYGYAEGTEEYNSKYEELKDAAISDCVTDCEGECPGSISYTTTHMEKDDAQSLGVDGSTPVATYTWSVSGGGSLDTEEGTSVVYTAPSSASSCSPVTITLMCDGDVIDTLEITINAYSGSEDAFLYKTYSSCTPVTCGGGAPGSNIIVTVNTYTCSGDKIINKSCGPTLDTVCGSNLEQCGEDALTSSNCLSPNWTSVGGGYSMDTYHDLRTQAMIDAGCCPEELL